MIKQIFNSGWYFKFGENKGDEREKEIFDYLLIGLPHSFGIPYYGEDNFYIGYGCYYKKINLKEKPADEILILEFGAVFQVAEVFVNGEFVMSHEGGYTAFGADITKFVKAGENTVFVRVNNLWNPVIAPRAGEHTFNGGIYRDVYLIWYPSSHISLYGVGITSEKSNENQYIITVTTETENCIGLKLVTSLADKDGAEILSQNCLVEKNITVQKLYVQSPELWDIDNPYLYKIKSSVGTDSLVTEFGIRTIKWSKDSGFYLNGRHLLLDGANVHSDHGGWGDAVTHSGIRRDVMLMKECGFNFIRGSHYPHHTEFAKECDRRGILFWSESVFWGIGGFQKDGYWNSSAMPVKKEHYKSFEKSLKQTTYEMIRQNRNSPSIICWSVGNEMFFSKKEVLPDARELVKRMVDFCHSVDSSRPAAVGGVQREGFDVCGDIAGYNGDGAVLFTNPPVPNMVSEYGSIAAYRPGKYELYETEGSDKYYDWRAGRAVWCGFHHGSIANIGNLGICDLYRLPLRAYFCHRKRLRNIEPPKFPMNGKGQKLKITTDKNTALCDGTDDCMVIIRVYDKNDKRITGDYNITLEVTSGPAILPTGKKMTFTRQNQNSFDGACAIEVRSYFAGKSVLKASCFGLESDKTELEFTGGKEFCGENISYPVAQYERPQKAFQKDINLINNRPVSVSSEKKESSYLCLTSDSKYKCWQPSQDDANPQIILDTENCYDNFQIKLSRGVFFKNEYSVFTSLDKENWSEVSHNIKSNISFVKPLTRYIKLEFSGFTKVKKIKIFKK